MTYVTQYFRPASIGTNGQTLVLSAASSEMVTLGYSVSVPVRKYVLETTVSAPTKTSVALTSFTFTYDKNGIYMFDACMLVQTSVATNGIQFAISVGSAVSIVTIAGATVINSSSNGGFCHGYADKTYVGLITSLATKATTYPIIVKGILNGKTASKATIRFKSDQSDDSVVKVMAGSTLVIYKVG